MSFVLLRSDAFIRAARRCLRKDRGLADSIRESLVALAEDPFKQSLRTHKLKGRLEGSWACSAGFDLRIVFRFVDYQDRKAILLETIGSHDEVY